LGDLYGAVGFPRCLSRTIIVGRKVPLVEKFLHVLTYFIRCSELVESRESFPVLDNVKADGIGGSTSTVPSPSDSAVSVIGAFIDSTTTTAVANTAVLTESCLPVPPSFSLKLPTKQPCGREVHFKNDSFTQSGNSDDDVFKNSQVNSETMMTFTSKPTTGHDTNGVCGDAAKVTVNTDIKTVNGIKLPYSLLYRDNIPETTLSVINRMRLMVTLVADKKRIQG
jgi:hypothetical protein